MFVLLQGTFDDSFLIKVCIFPTLLFHSCSLSLISSIWIDEFDFYKNKIPTIKNL